MVHDSFVQVSAAEHFIITSLFYQNFEYVITI